MQQFMVKWAFYLIYSHHKGELFLHASQTCQQDFMSPSEMILTQEQMRSIIHKYDYRKFHYFAEQSLKKPFDTMIRLKCENHKDYVRTQAICESTSDGFRCILIEDQYYHELTKHLIQNKLKDAKFSWLDETLSAYESTQHLRIFKQHLTQMMLRETN